MFELVLVDNFKKMPDTLFWSIFFVSDIYTDTGLLESKAILGRVQQLEGLNM